MASIDDREKIVEIVKSFGKLIQEKNKGATSLSIGSYTKGTHSPESDIDIAVVADNFGGDPIEDAILLMKLRRKIEHENLIWHHICHPEQCFPA